jgi:hypothetical protein
MDARLSAIIDPIRRNLTAIQSQTLVRNEIDRSWAGAQLNQPWPNVSAPLMTDFSAED